MLPKPQNRKGSITSPEVNTLYYQIEQSEIHTSSTFVHQKFNFREKSYGQILE